MADKPKPRYRREVSPGITGALKDAGNAIIDATAPRAVRQRQRRLEQEINDMSSGRQRQSTDAANGY
jgi:hypothetical protein